jgi:hypothetical protein
MRIIETRITKALALTARTSVPRQNANPDRRRRGAISRGSTEHMYPVSVRLSGDLKRALDRLCADLNVERGMILRDALKFYLGMAEQEGLTAERCPTTLKHR